MLTVKKTVTRTVSILGRSVAPLEQLTLIKNSKIDREVKDVLRQCLITAMNFESSSKDSLDKSKTLVRKSGDSCEITSRSAAFTAASAMKLKKWNDVDDMLRLSTHSPPVITSSIRIRSLAEQSKLSEALSELEKVLMFEEEVFSTSNYSVSDEALDSLCQAIKSASQSTDEMKRFRNLQRLVTKYDRRTSQTIEDLLYTPIHVEKSEPETEPIDETFVKSKKFQDFVKQIPYMKDKATELK